MLTFLPFVLQYCSGGSVTDLVKRLKERGQAMKEDHIAYILYHTVQVRAPHCPLAA